MAQSGTAGSAALDHILARIAADIDFLVAQSSISIADAQVIRSRLPASAAQLSAATSTLSIGGPEPTSITPARAVPPPPVRAPIAPPAGLQQATALWAYDSSNPEDLRFAKGDVIEVRGVLRRLAEPLKVIETPNEHWLRGRLHGHEGLFPANHVQMLHPGAQSPQPSGGFQAPPSSQFAQQSFAAPPAYNGPPPQQPQQQLYQPYQQDNKYQQTQPGGMQPAPQQIAPAPAPQKNHRFGSFGNTLAHSAVGGVGAVG